MVPLVYLACGFPEPIPYLIFGFLRHRSYFAPLVVKLLKQSEGIHRVGLEHKFLCLFTQPDLEFEIFSQIKVSQLLIYLYIIIEDFHTVVIVFPQVFKGGLRNHTN